MIVVGSEQESEVDRLSFAILRDAYCDLATVLKLAKPRAGQTVLLGLEAHVVAALSRLSAERARDGSIDPVTLAVAERLRAVLDEAHMPVPVDLAELPGSLGTGWTVEPMDLGARDAYRRATAGAAGAGRDRGRRSVPAAA